MHIVNYSKYKYLLLSEGRVSLARRERVLSRVLESLFFNRIYEAVDTRFQQLHSKLTARHASHVDERALKVAFESSFLLLHLLLNQIFTLTTASSSL
jgi:hypothetical protein